MKHLFLTIMVAMAPMLLMAQVLGGSMLPVNWTSTNPSHSKGDKVLKRGENGEMAITINNTNSTYGIYFSEKEIGDQLSDTRFGFFVNANNVYAVENGDFTVALAAPVQGDVLTIKRDGAKISWIRNNAIVKWAVPGANHKLFVNSLKFIGSLPPTEANFEAPGFIPSHADDDDLNWVHTKTFNGLSTNETDVTSESRSYSDEMGRPTQSQSKNYATGHIWANQTIYDSQGRPAISTMAAPTGDIGIGYKENFVLAEDGTPYGPVHFDTPSTKNNPARVGEQTGSLGAWYSGQNLQQREQATTDYPYARVEYSTLTGSARRSAAAGNHHRMGAGHETASYNMKAAGELHYLLGLRDGQSLWNAWILLVEHYLQNDEIGSQFNLESNPFYSIVKTIGVDEDGKQAVVFTDLDGNEVAKCLAGQKEGQNVQVQHVSSPLFAYSFADIHVPQGCENTVFLIAANSANQSDGFLYDVFDLGTDVKILADQSAPTLNISQPGFYRIVSKKGFDKEIRQQLNYYNWSLNIYDDAQRLIATVPPNGIDKNFIPSLQITDVYDTKNLVDIYQSGSAPNPKPTLADIHFNELLTTQLPVANEGDERVINVFFGLNNDNSYIADTPYGRIAQDGQAYHLANPASTIPDAYREELLENGNHPNGRDDIEDFYFRDEYYAHIEVLKDGSPITGSERTLTIKHHYEVDMNTTTELGWDYTEYTDVRPLVIPEGESENIGQLSIRVKRIGRSAKKIVIGDNGFEYVHLNEDGVNWEVPAATPVGPFIFDANFFMHMKVEVKTLPTIPQHQQVSLFKYNSLGEMIWSISPDQGLSRMQYQKNSYPVFSQNSQQEEEDKFSYSISDRAGRVLESGIYNSNTSGGTTAYTFDTRYQSDNSTTKSIVETPEALDEQRREERSHILYDRPTTGDLPPDRYQQFVMGKISKTWNDNATYWYSYNELGQVTWMAQEIQGMPEIKYIDYGYDLLGNIVKVAYQAGQPDEFTHHFTFNDYGQLLRIETNAYGLPPVEQASYHYYTDGTLKKTNIAEGLQENDYVYTLQGWLKAVNADNLNINGNSDKLFSMALEYFNGDYLPAGSNFTRMFISNGSHTGKINAQRWKTTAGSNTGYFANQYSYNDRNELEASSFGAPLKQLKKWIFSPSANYGVSNLSYDDNGNILSLNRDAYGTDVNKQMDRLSYNYNPGTNQLDYISDSSIGTIDFEDLKNQSPGNYTYDNLGQLIEDVSEDLKIAYTPVGLVKEIRELSTNRLKAEYFYGPSGKRVSKKQYIYPTNQTIPDLKESWYLRNGSSISSIYEQTTVAGTTGTQEQVEMPIYGSGRLGVAYRDAATTLDYRYELSDHLGNVRVTFRRGASNQPEVLSYADYYAFGWQMPGRNSNTNTYRFGYQGQFAEIDEETGWNSFELRSYDGRVGRWMTIDPYRQYHSPYLAMGNDPVGRVDPNGGEDWYIDKETGEYVWFDGNEVLPGYAYFGEKYTLFGELESLMPFLHEDGFRFSFVKNTSGAILPFGDNLLDDFLFNLGSKNSIFLGDHPYTISLMDSWQVNRARGYFYEGLGEVEGKLTDWEGSFPPWSILSTGLDLPEQFVGSFGLDIYLGHEGDKLFFILSDSKSRTSLFYHLPFNNLERDNSQSMGNTFQWYIWTEPYTPGAYQRYKNAFKNGSKFYPMPPGIR